MPDSYILAARRTPIGKLLGSLAAVPAPRLAAVAIRAALADSGLMPNAVNEVILGNVLSAGVGQAPARQAALAAGIPPTVGAVTINKVCGSGLKAVMLADQAIRAGDAETIVAGGMENMSLAPHLLPGVRSGWKFGAQEAIDSMQHDGLWCAVEDKGMGSLADYIAAKCGISREEQDAFAAQSHRRAVEAQSAGNFQRQIVPVSVKSGKAETTVERDEGPRPNCLPADLAKLRPAFAPDGTATAGNASQISDGAAAVVVVSESVANATKSAIRARIVATATSGVEPKDLFIAPVSAIQAVLAKAGLSIHEIDLVELNEAFASQCLACMRPLDLDPAKVNVHGGAIALGHPIGASGARVLVTLLHALVERKLRYGLAALCLGGGNAVAMIVERAS
ncbi:MAG: acetyl-CoA C-acyltransferase [Planctomycetaceae bacterium]|nr:acetyl-CoA C-acyltransferase [Planctomycetaceae bacterium]